MAKKTKRQKTEPSDRILKRGWRSKPAFRTLETLISSLLIALIAKQFVIQAFRIPSGSMEDTLLVGDFLFVNKLLYGPEIPYTGIRLPALRSPQRGDIIVFRAPHTDKDFIKRCVAVEGDTIQYVSNQLHINGEAVEEPYKCIKRNPIGPRGYHKDFPDLRQLNGIPPGQRHQDENGYQYIVPAEHIFMMGDNRNNSEDSRFWGPLSLDRIKGKALVIYMSVDLNGKRLRLPRVGRIIA